MDNYEFSKTDLLFKKACELAGVKATTRQASKWRNKKGRAFEERTTALVTINNEKNEENQ